MLWQCGGARTEVSLGELDEVARAWRELSEIRESNARVAIHTQAHHRRRMAQRRYKEMRRAALAIQTAARRSRVLEITVAVLAAARMLRAGMQHNRVPSHATGSSLVALSTWPFRRQHLHQVFSFWPSTRPVGVGKRHFNHLALVRPGKA